MNQKEFNVLLYNLSDAVKPINQLLYESIILIIFYYIFKNISFINVNNNSNKKFHNNSQNNYHNNHKKFIYLIFLICIILDWFMWNNYTQTFLFVSILYVYIYYNINTCDTISTFINIVNESRTINKINDNNDIKLNDNILEQIKNDDKQQDEIDMITFVPKDITIRHLPEPYQKNLEGNNELNSAFKSSIPSIHITDSTFAENQLNELHKTPQYKNIKKMTIDVALSNAINNDNNLDNGSENDAKNLDLFRKPLINFLDNKWLTLKENTYNDNDNCKNCKPNQNQNNNKNNNKNKNKNAICYVYNYGQELEECTNQDNTVNNDQLNKISTNKVMPIYKM